MALLPRFKARLVKLLLPIFGILLLLYISDQLLRGERGVVTWRLMQEQVDDLRQVNARMKADMALLNDHVNRLKPNAYGRLDEDYVDELIRRNLPMTKTGEQVILLGAPSPTTVSATEDEMPDPVMDVPGTVSDTSGATGPASPTL